MTPNNDDTPRSPAWLRWALVALVVLGALHFVARGPARTLTSANMDASFLAIGGRALLNGDNPYDPEDFNRIWLEKGADPTEPSPYDKRGLQVMVYPPSAYLLATPLGLLDLTPARIAWNTVNTLAYLASIALVVVIARLRPGPKHAPFLALLAGALLLNAGTSVIALGQTSAVPMLLISAGTLAFLREKRLLAGVLIGSAAAIKPQLGLPYVYLLLFWTDWRALGTAIATGLALLGTALVRLWVAGVPVIESWRTNIAEFSLRDANPLERVDPHYPFQHLEIGAPIAVVTGSAVTGRIAGLAIGIALLAAYSLVARTTKAKAAPQHLRRLCDLSFISTLLLVAVFHRTYDGVVLLLPLAFAIVLLAQRRWRLAIPLALPLVPMLFPLPAAIWKAGERGLVPSALHDADWWELVVLMHQSYMLLLAALACILIRARLADDSGANAGIR